MKSIALISLTMTLLLISCFKETNTSSVTTDNFELISSNTARILNDIQIDSIGNFHNTFLYEIFEIYNYSTTDTLFEIISIAETLAANNNATLDSSFTYTSLNNYISIIQDSLSTTAFSIIQSAVNLTDSITSLNNFISSINLLEFQANNTLVGQELDIVLTTLCVSRYSAEFWLPISSGGSGIGDDIFDNLNEGKTSDKQKRIGKVIASDMASAGVGLIVGAFFTAFTGGAGTPMLVAAGIEAAAASGISASGILD